MPPVEFEPTIPVSEQPQTHALDRTATGIGMTNRYNVKYIPFIPLEYHYLLTQSPSVFINLPPSCNDFRNSVGVEIGLFLSQQFSNSHFHFRIIVEKTTSHVLLQRPKQVVVRGGQGQDNIAHSPNVHRENTATTFMSDVRCDRPLSNSSLHLVTSCTLITPSPDTSVNWR
jgi:hypothetical protein